MRARREGELMYDYCCYRRLDKYWTRGLLMGRVMWQANRFVQDSPTKGHIEVHQGTYNRPDKFRKSVTKAQKKAFKKARRAMKFKAQAEEAVRASVGTIREPLMVSP